MSYSTGIVQPPDVDLHIDGNVFPESPVHSTLSRLELSAGPAIGTAEVSYPYKYAKDATPNIGKRCYVERENTVIFAGTILDSWFRVGAEEDVVQLILVDDKHRMTSMTVGQYGVGSVDDGAGGFPDVGYEVIFNKDGRPNKDPSTRTFNTGSTAEFWTLEDIIRFLFQWYIPTTAAQLGGVSFSGTAWAREPSNLNLVGQTGLQAVDQVVQLSGETWGLKPGKNYSEFLRIRPNVGDLKRARLFDPKAGSSVRNATDEHAGSVEAGVSARNVRDHFQVISGFVVKETTYDMEGDDPLLARHTSFLSHEWAARFGVDVSKYEAHALGKDLSTGSRPKPWAANLATRLAADGSAYLTAAEIAAAPRLEGARRLEPIVWISSDGTTDNRRRVLGGYDIDLEEGTISFEGTVEVASQSGTASAPVKEDLEITDWSAVHVWLTVATILEVPQCVESGNDSEFLEEPFYEVVHKPDLVPERRENCLLPDLAGSGDQVVTISADTEELYVDVESRLQDVLDALEEASPEVETPIRAVFDFLPAFQLGDRLQVSGRDVGATGREVVTEIGYNVHEDYRTHVAATNVARAVDPDAFVR